MARAPRLRAAVILLILLLSSLLMFVPAAAQSKPAPRWAIVVHGGAGVIERTDLRPEQAAAYRTAMGRVAEAGAAVLQRGGSSLDAVETVIKLLEADPLFNAGRGAVFTAD